MSERDRKPLYGYVANSPSVRMGDTHGMRKTFKGITEKKREKKWGVILTISRFPI
jgi:hypothetical protein